MLVALYKTKKELKESKGSMLRFEETSLFGPEYNGNGILTVVGPGAYDRKWFARVTMENDVIKRVE